MKKEHKTMSVVAALVLLLVIGYVYNRSNKEGMAGGSAKNLRNRNPKSSGQFKPNTITEHVLHFLSMVWLVDFFKKLSGGATPKAAAADARTTQARVIRNASNNRRAAMRRLKEMQKQTGGGPTAAGARAAGANGAGGAGAGAGAEGFANRGRVRRRGPWRPPGSVALM